MRMVVAYVQPTKVKAVQEALARIGVDRMTVCDAMGYGQQMGSAAAQSAMTTSVLMGPTMLPQVQGQLLRKVVLEIAVNEDFLEKTVDTIARVARTGTDGAFGDGKIFVLPVEEVIRLSDTVRGPEAVS